MVVQIICHSGQALVGVNIAVIDNSDHFRFVLRNHQITVFEAVAIWSKAAIPFPFTGFLLPSSHCLCPNILTLNFCYRRENGNHQLTGILGAVNAIFHTNQIHAKILHELQGVENISCISSKTGQLEYQYKRNIVLAFLNVIQHPLKFQPSLNILAGKAFV